MLLLADHKAGMDYRELAVKYGLSPSYVWQCIAFDSDEAQAARAVERKKLQSSAVGEAHALWLAWKAEHVRTCDDLPGDCCDDCHKGYTHGKKELSFRRRDGIYYYTCCKRTL